MPIEVFHVDDNPMDLEITQMAFSEVAGEVRYRPEKDPEHALSLLEDWAAARGVPPPDLIILDINMPRLSGIDLLSQLKNDPLLQAVPVIIFTTSARDRDHEECRARGAAEVHQKPSDYPSLLDFVRSLVGTYGS